MKTETPKNNKHKLNIKGSVIFTATMIFVVVILFLIALNFRLNLKGFKRADEAREYDKYYVMITDNYKSDFWKAVYRSAFEEAQKDNIYLELFGESFATNYSPEELMKIATASKVDGIIVYANESNQMTRLINDASSKGIPVVTLYGDNTKSHRLSFVGVGSYNIGREYAKQVINIIKEKKSNESTEADNTEQQKTMKVTVLLDSNVDDTGQNLIISAMQDSIAQEEEVTEDLKLSFSNYTVDNTNAFSAEESIRDIFHVEEIPDVIVCLNELNTVCTYQAVVDFNKVGVVDILGYYDSESIINAIDRGVVYATIAIDSKQLGEYCITALSDYYETGNTNQYYTADVRLIDKNNVSEYMKKEDKDE
ncbi:MAG: substrate-binding domain-containing protein [Butyrivibrio sp.]|nr:substrate-binding domain-containing protein [Butyrivibrio sp.]